MNEFQNILLVDDDTDDQMMFTYALKEVDDKIECACVGTAEEALVNLQNHDIKKPDYIFLDLNLPLMDGLACLENIRKRQELIHIPVVIYSTSNRPFDMQKAKELGARDYIQKPSTFDELKRTIQKVLTLMM